MSKPPDDPSEKSPEGGEIRVDHTAGVEHGATIDRPSRTVALKVIRGGALSASRLRRFEHESQVLGRLQHPGIAQIYEAGTVKDEQGRTIPYFARTWAAASP